MSPSMKGTQFESILGNLSFAFLLLSMLLYWFQASFESNKGIKKIPYFTMWLANGSLAIMLLIRWVESGHFPLSNLYESLLFLSWSFISIHFFLERAFYRRGIAAPTLGAVTSPIALFTNAFATFSLPQEMQKATVLVPALQSNWLMMHVSVMMVSYAALLSGSLLAMAFLVVKVFDEQGSSPMASSLHPLDALLCFAMNRTASQSRAKHSVCKDDMYTKPNQQVSFQSAVESPDASSVDSMKEFAMLYDAVLCDVSHSINEMDESNSSKKGNGALQEMQSNTLGQTLDNLSYRSIGLGFALLTIGILSGAVWANEAWGSYWSWDPKETWAFITWLVFAIYLHTRLSRGWTGKESAFVATFGFLVVWSCYLGVNLFGKGLHSYGWFQ